MKTLYLVRTFLPCIILFFGIELVAQPWTYDFGTGTGTHTSTTASETFLPNPSSGTDRVRVGTNPGSITMANAGLSALGTDTELQITSNTGSASTTKFSIYNYTAGKTGYVKFNLAIAGGTNGVYNFSLGDGATYSDNTAMNNAQIFSGIRWSLGASNAVTYNVLSNTTWTTTGITNPTTLFTQSTSTVYEVEVYANNETTSRTYYRNGTSYTLTNATWDLWVDGTRVGTGLAKGNQANNTNIDSYAFNHQVSASAPGTLYLDDLEYANSLPVVSISDNGTQVAAANVAESTTNHILNKIKIDAISGFNPNLTGMTCTTAGGYDAADITNLKVRYSTDATLDGGDATLSTLSSPGAAGAKTFPSFSSQTITGGTSGYIFITADIAASSASSGNTISVNALTTSNLTFSTGIKESLATAGGTQTIVASASITTSTISPLEYCAGNNVSVAYSTSGSFSGTFTAQLSDDAGDFSAPINIGTGASPITATIPTGTATGIGYRIRVVNNTPAVNGSDNGDDIEIYNSTTTVSPTTTQNISVSTNGTTLTVTEGSTPTSRRWRWSTTSGSGYADFSPTETGTTYIPNFASANTYYVVCEATYPSPCGVVTTTSSEVQINVTANSITTGTVSSSSFCSGDGDVTVQFTYSPTGSFPSGGSCSFTAQLSDENGDFTSPTNLNSVVSNASGSQSIGSNSIPSGAITGTGYRIRVISNNPAITGSDNGSNLSITNSITPSVSIAITTGSNPMCAGASVTFTATPTNGGGTPAYQWKVNGVDDGTNSATFTTTSLAHNDVVTCVMTTSVTCPTSPTATSSGITMTVTALVTPTVSIAVTTGSNPTCSGNSVTFTATPANLNGGSVAANAYQWKKGGVDIAGETASTYTSTTLANGEVITCAITVSGGCVTSSSATSSGITMVIYALPGNPTNPVAAVNPACTSTTLNTMTVPGGETYFWQGTTSNGAIDNLGDATSTYAVSSTGTYYVRAQNSNGCWSTGRGSVTVTVNTAITIGTSPTNQSVTSPATATFSVSGITGTIGGYQWEVSTDGGTNWNDVTTGTGGTTASYTTAATTTAMNNYQYRCIVLGTSPCADVTSSAATLTVAAGPCFSVDFETGNLSEWTSPGGTVNGATVNGGSGDYYLNLNINGEWARLPTSNSYSSVSFNLKGSASSNSWTLYVQYSTDGGTNWNNISGAGTIAGSSIGTSYALQTVTIPTITSDVRLFLQRTSNSCYIGDLNAFCVTCTAPTTQATSITTNTPTTGGFSIGWTAGDGDGTMIVVRPTSSANTIPAFGTSYSPDLAWATAEQIDANNRVVFRNAGSTAGPVTGLTAETQYTITAYEYNTTDDCYNLTSPPSATRYTLSNEPGAHPATFTTSVCGNASLTLNFSAASTITNADGYIILRRQDGFNPTTTDVTDGIEPGSLSLPVGTTLVTTIANTATTSYVNTGLSAGTTYNYLIIPYNANVGAVAQTFNYRTSATPLTVSATTGNASSNSDIIVDPTFTYNSNILYTSYQGNPITNTTNSVGVLGLRIRDGGGASDGDAFSTTLTGIAFTVNSVAQSSVRRYALFQGNTFVTEIANPGTSTVAFSGLSISAADNANTDFTLRVSFNNTAATITDNTQMTFSVASATTVSGCATVSSQFSAFSTVNSSTTSDRNRIEVVATQIVFGTQPASASANTNLNAFTIRFEDNNNILDFDSNRSITLTATDGGVDMSASPSYSITATHTGIITISNVQFTSAPQDDITITATTTGLTTNVVESNPFDIFDIPIGSYRTIGSGTWLNTTGTSTWEELTSGGWAALGAGVTPTINGSPTFNVYIYHNVSLTAPSTNKNIFIENGGTLNTGTQSHTFRNVLVKNGGVFNKEAGNGTKFDASGVLEVLDGGAMWFSRTNSSAYATNLWAGTEKFHPNSNFVVLVTDEASGDGRLLTEVMDSISSFNGAKFGNFIINMSGNGNFPLFPAGINTKLTNGDFILRNATDNGMIFNNGSYTVTIGGDLIVESTYPQPFTLTNSASTVSFTVNDDVVHNGTAEFRLANSQTTNNPSVTLNIDSNLIIGSSNFNFDIGTSSTGTNKSIVNLKGDLTTGTGSILTGNTTTAKRGELNFMGTYDENDLSTIQTVDVASTGSNENAKVYFNVKDNSYTQLITRNFELGLNSKLTIEDGAIFDFGFNGTTPLILNTYTTGAQFDSDQGSTLKITSPDGLYEEWDRAAYTAAGVTVNTGNVQTIVKSNRSISPIATFWYIGKANQKTGDAPNVSLSTTADAKIVICDLDSNIYTLTPTVSFGVTNTTTLSPTGGKLDIRKGQFIETETEYIFGSTGTLYMSPGTLYRIVKGYSVLTNEVLFSDSTFIPRMLGSTYPYVLTGGTIELAGNANTGNGFQTLRGTFGGRPDYNSVKFSSNNDYDAVTKTATNYKNLSSTTTVDTAVIITDNAIVDCIGMAGTAQSFDGNGALVMDGNSRIRLKNVSATQPELAGNNRDYSLIGGTVEFYGTSATQQQQLRGNYRTAPSSPVKINYYNIDVNAAAANLQTFATLPNSTQLGSVGNVDVNSSFLLTGALNVNAPAVLRMDQNDFIDNGTGTSQVININSGAGLLYANEYGIKTSGTGISDGNIRTSGTRNFSTTANYGFVSSGNMVSGNGLPANVAGLYIYKTFGINGVTLNNGGTTVNGILGLQRGKILSSDTHKLTLAAVSTSDIKSPANVGGVQDMGTDSSYVVGLMGHNSSTTSQMIFPIGDYAVYGPIALTPQGTTSQTYNCDYVSAGFGDQTLDPTNSPQLDHVSYVEYWNVNSTVSGASDNARVKLFWRDHSIVGPPANWSELRVVHYDGTDWNTEGNSPTISGLSTSWGSVETNIYVPDFSPITLSTTTSFNPLPVELLSFTASAKCPDIVLNWSTATELNNDYFEVQHSFDGINFETIEVVEGNGTTNQLQNYQFTHLDVVPTINFYRLKQVDYDGTEDYSATINAACGLENYTVGLMNTLSGNELILQFQNTKNQDGQLIIYGANGQVVNRKMLALPEGYSQVRIDISNLPNAMYIVQWFNGNEIVEEKFIKNY